MVLTRTVEPLMMMMMMMMNKPISMLCFVIPYLEKFQNGGLLNF
jgi:hypothetical protein